jgi:ATP-dependent helicase YprA (DUF1998 family)
MFYQLANGQGISTKAFDRVMDILDHAYRIVRDCPCTQGCPFCK